MIKIELTKEQKAQLEPMFAHAQRLYDDGRHCGILAQVWSDGMVVAAIKDDQARGIAKILKETDEVTYKGSAKDKMGY